VITGEYNEYKRFLGEYNENKGSLWIYNGVEGTIRGEYNEDKGSLVENNEFRDCYLSVTKTRDHFEFITGMRGPLGEYNEDKDF